MGELEKLLLKIDIPSHQVTLDLIQEILIEARRHKTDEHNSEFWSQVCQVLWKHLQTGLKKFDDQLLCATCFCTIMPLTDKQDCHIKEMLNIIKIELNLKNDDKDSTNLCQAVSIMYGMFQSTFLTQNLDSDTKIKETILESTFELLTLMAYEYSQYTFIVFKTIKAFSKVIGNNFQNIIFSNDKQVRLLNLVNHNWENPITGVRDLNRDIFQTLLSSVDNEMYELMLEEINSFYWNKAKFLMISEIVEHCNNNIYDVLQKNNWVYGLLYSLHKPGLVSAGADMYYAILKKIRSESEWCTLLLQDIIKIANSTSYKAIGNFNNYWCLITLKKFPTLINVFLDELQKFDDTEQKLYSSLFLIKQGNKLGLISKNWASTMDYKYSEKMVLRGIEHYNNYIRMLAFDIVCMTQGKVIPGKVEFELILDVLNNNINSDCSILRLGMLSSLKQFLLQLHATFLNNMKNKQYVDEENLLKFCKKIQEIVIHSLTLNGNYQRKITCVKVANTIFSCISSVPKKRKDQIRVINTTLLEFLKDKNCWMLSNKEVIGKFIDLLKDPADDIRENVVQLLLNHYPKDILRVDLMTDLIDNAMKCLKSKFFFEISCGQSIFKLVVNIILRYEYKEATFKNVDDVFLFGCKELIDEYRLKRDVLTSIESGKQLHSFMSILLVTLETCILNSYKMKSSNIRITDLLDALEGISNQFSWEQENSTSNDFSKLSEMVQTMITQSGYNPTDGHDETKISGLHQIVLNCIWLNVKASCDLASLLIQYYTEDIDVCKRSIFIITHVLETSRHKGAIEAGGAALGRGIQHLISQPEESDISKLPQCLLQSKLNDLLSETNRMASITRRGAGLSIMVHRIVSSDMRKGKPLFHYFMKILLETCNKTDDIPDIQKSSKTDIEMDLPKAIYIHFLTRIVTDSSLASDLMYYSSELAELAFFNLTSPHWQIRNAALQLYGALIPRQIGQKKASGSDEETVATVACDELRTHTPKLWKYIMEKLKNDNPVDEVLSQSNLVPILNILANCAKRYNFSHDMAVQKNSDAELLASLISLLGSPIYTVRRLTAKCIFNIYTFETIYYAIINQEIISENFLHGSLILIENCIKYYAENHSYEDRFIKLREKFKLILTVSPHSYLCKDIFEDIVTGYDFPINYLEETITQLNSSKNIPGVFKWADNRFRKYLLNSTWNDIPRALKLSLDCCDFINYCEFLYLKIENDKNIPKKVIQNIVDILLTYDKKYNSSIIWKIIYHMSQLTKLEIDITSILENFENIQMTYKLRYVIPLAARECVNIAEDDKNQIKIANIIYKLCGLENTDVDMRYIAALANNELANVFSHLSNLVRGISIKSAVILLQDEDEDVRMLSVNFYKNINKLDVAVHPYLCLCKILDSKFLYEVLNNAQQEIKVLCNDLSEKLLCTNCNNDEYNPFANDSKNIYLEGNVLRDMLKNLMSD